MFSFNWIMAANEPTHFNDNELGANFSGWLILLFCYCSQKLVRQSSVEKLHQFACYPLTNAEPLTNYQIIFIFNNSLQLASWMQN